MDGNALELLTVSANVTGMFKRVYKMGRNNQSFIDPVNGQLSQLSCGLLSSR